MKKKCVVLLVLFLVVLLAASCTTKKGGQRQPCRPPDDPLGLCDGGLYCSENNICLECGGEGNPCCESEGTDACQKPLICGENGRCSRCGADHTPCCEGGWCGEDLFCGADNTCAACGRGEGLPCCEGAFCYGGLSCSEGTCTSQVCDEGGSCQTCGRIGEPCCAGGACAANSTCNAEGICVDCGGLGEPACSNRMCGYWQRDLVTSSYTPCECDAWFASAGGMCGVPWKADPQGGIEACMPRFGYADQEIFEVDAPSTSDIEHAEWCFWYAAYFKNDLSLCENIMWGEMKTKCAEGENPEDYFAIITFE